MDDAMKAHVERTRKEASHDWVHDAQRTELDRLVQEEVILTKKPKKE